MNTEHKEHAAKAANFVTGLLTGWGVPAAWAKAVSGAIIGAAIGALDGRSVEQLLALFEQAKATKDKKDDAFVAQLIQLMQMQADVGAKLQGEVRRLKRKTERLTSRNFD